MDNEIEQLREDLREANARREDLRTALEWANGERDRLREQLAAKPGCLDCSDYAATGWRLVELADKLQRERDEAHREADRLRHGNTVEGDFVCPNEEERTRAQARLFDAALIHADLVRERDEARAAAFAEAIAAVNGATDYNHGFPPHLDAIHEGVRFAALVLEKHAANADAHQNSAVRAMGVAQIIRERDEACEQLSEAVETYKEARRSRWHSVNALNEASKERDEARASCETLANNHILLAEELAALRRERDEALHVCGLRLDMMKRLERDRDKERDAAKRAIADAEKERDEARAECESLRKQVSMLNMNCATHYEHGRKVGRWLDEAIEQRDEARAEVAKLHRLLKLAEDECISNDNHGRAEARRADNLEAEVEELRAEAERLRDRLQCDPGGSDKLDELEQACSMLRAEVERLRWLAEAGCENAPTKNCDCPGCCTARERADRGEA